MRRLLLVVNFVILCSSVIAQGFGGDSLNVALAPGRPSFKPIIGLGTGLFSYYGDLYEKKLVNPQVSRIGWELSVSHRFSPSLDLNFYALFGKLGANERTDVRNVNIQSEIRVGGVQLIYTFAHLMPGRRTIHPYISSGFESFEFLSKTDLIDKNGNVYHYWSDGSIRNIDEKSPDASKAIVIQRDYTYESDVRELNLDDFGKYPERSFAIPAGAGFFLHLSDRVDVKIGATMHFTMTDYIDGITADSKGNRKGNSKNDHYMMTAFSLRYDLIPGNTTTLSPEEELRYQDAEIFVLEREDEDKDGVLDMVDKCLGTPPNAPVDGNGCPLDDDKDGIPNYRDQEPQSSPGAVVDVQGVTISDSLLALKYDMYMDSTGKYTKVVVLPSDNRPVPGGMPAVARNYTIKLGEFSSGVPSELMTKFLSIPDVETRSHGDSVTVYFAGRYASEQQAEAKKEEFINSGIPDAKVMYLSANGKLTPPPVLAVNPGNPSGDPVKPGSDPATPNDTAKTGSDPAKTGDPVVKTGTNPGELSTSTIPATEGVVFRIQLGAYKRKLSKRVFGVDDVIQVQTDDGLYKYLTGSYKTFDEAAKRRVDVLVNGFPDAFVVAYKDGKRIPLTSVGATPSNPEPEPENLEEPKGPMSTANKELVVFKVQLGVYKNEPPADMQEKFKNLPGIEKGLSVSGLTRYTAGSFNDYNAAVALKNEIREKYGVEDAFVIAFFKDQYISVQEALELMK